MAGQAVRVLKRYLKKGDVPPIWVSEDRHNPLPHIAPLTTALKSAYKNAAFPSTRTSAELRELLTRAAGNDGARGLLRCVFGRGGIA